MDSDKSSEAASDEFEVVDKQEKMSPSPNLLISVNGDAELQASLDSALKETDSVNGSRVTTPSIVLEGNGSSSSSCMSERQDETGVVYNKVVYLGAANISSPRSEGEIQKTIAIMRQQSISSTPIPVSISVPSSSDGAVILYEASTQLELARYPISRILYFARGVAGSPECSCFAFTCARGESHDSALFQSHVFRCDIPEAIGKVFTSFGHAFRKQRVQSPDKRPMIYIPCSPPSEVVFEVCLEIREADLKGNYGAVPKDKNFFKVRSNVEKQVIITLQQISEGLVLNIERCFGLLISPGKAVKKSDMHLLEMVSMGTTTVDKRSLYTITGSWDPCDPAFSQLNKETPREVEKVYMTVAADLVISGIREPVRFDIETKLRVFSQSEKFWYITRKHHVENFTLSLKEVVDAEDRHYEVVSVESSGEIEKSQKSIGLTLNLGSLSLNSSTLSSLPSISPLTVDTPKEDEISDNDEPLLSGSGEVSKECSESELESWAQVLEVWKENPDVLPKQLQSLIKGGIPEALRGEIWLRLVGCFDQSDLMDTYRILITKECSEEEVILRDLHRTFPAHDYFKENGGHGQDALAKIVKAYSIYDEEIGYCQGITFIAAALLLHMPEEQAFCVLVKIMADYGLRDLFKDGLEVLHLRFYQLDRLLEEQMPDLFSHFLAQGVESHMYASQWFLTLFTAKFPLYLVFRIVDLFLYARMDAIFQIALALLSVSKKDLMQLSFENVLKYFRVQLPKRFRSEESARHLMRVASSMKVKKLARYEKGYLEYKALSEDPLTKLEREKRILQKRVLDLEHENDSLAHELINVKFKLRGELDETERKLEISNRELQATRRSLKDAEEDRKRLETESLQVKEMLKKEILKNESETQRSSIIITEYKKICTQLSQQLEDGRKLVEEAAKSNEDEKCEACQLKRQLRPVGEELSMPQLQKHVRELELELAQTKLALVESQCKNQDLTHQATALTTELQASKSGWFQKTLTSIKEVAKTNINQPILSQPKPGMPFQKKDSIKEAQC